MITNFVVTLVLLNVQSSLWAHFKAHEVSFKMTYHTTALAQNCLRPLKMLFDHEFKKKQQFQNFEGKEKMVGQHTL